MEKWGRRIRAALGMGVIWAATWFVAGILLARVPGLTSDLPFALLFAPLGFITGVLFSVILVAIERRRSFERTSLTYFAALGAASGLLLSASFVGGAALRGQPLLGEFLVFGIPLGVAGAVCAAGSLAVARRAEKRELTGATAPSAVTELTERREAELLGRGD